MTTLSAHGVERDDDEVWHHLVFILVANQKITHQAL